MNIIDDSRRIEFTVLKVDSIPCSIVSKKMIFDYSGNCLSDPWDLKWPMPWIEEEFRKIVLKLDKVSKKFKKRVYNPEEPDQYVDVLINSYIDLTIAQLADYTADYYPEAEALVDDTGSRRLKYKDFKQLNTSLAKGLISIGVEKGNNVAVWAVNSPEFVISQFGIVKAGGVYVPLNAYEKEQKMELLLKNSDTHTLIMQVGVKGTENIDTLYKICPELRESIPGKLESEKFPNLKNVIVISEDEYPGTYSWSYILEKGSALSDDCLEERQSQMKIDDVAHIIHTSGSTGVPKGVMLSHGNIIENAYAMSNCMELTNKDIMCVQAPLFHCFGSIACTMAAVIVGCSMVLVRRFKANTTLSLLEREKCTVLSSVPTLFVSLIDHMQDEYFKLSLRTGIVAGAASSTKLLDDIQNVLGMKNILPCYGLTETSPCVSSRDVNEEFIKSSVGKPLPGVEVKIVDIFTKKEALPGQDGEILVRGYNVMQGYYKMPNETNEVIDSDGWLSTGDIGYIDENGYLYIKDRYKDIIIRCGENISPKEIEDVLITHEDISEVYVVGVPDSLKGEEVVAFIKLKEGRSSEIDIKGFCKGKLASIKIPKYFMFLDEFPKSDSGKVLKKELRTMALEFIENKVIQEIKI